MVLLQILEDIGKIKGIQEFAVFKELRL